jgi:hypothetical protein
MSYIPPEAEIAVIDGTSWLKAMALPAFQQHFGAAKTDA